MDGIFKVFAGILVALIALRIVAQLLVGLTDFSDLGCIPEKPTSLGGVVAELLHLS